MSLLKRPILYERIGTGEEIPREVSASFHCRLRKFRS
jgi:hypothetical protein